MNSTSTVLRKTLRMVATGAAAAGGVYAGYVAVAWSRYGHAGRGCAADRDERLDQFMPDYEVVERHAITVRAPAAITFTVAGEQDLYQQPVIRAIFKARELVLGATPETRSRPEGLLDQVRALGWGVLAEVPEREIVLGAVTKPWEADVAFRALPPSEFAAFCEPGYVKIAWTLRADPLDDEQSRFRTETRAIATDAESRRRFRRYWAFVSPGIGLIRRLSLRPLKQEAERRARQTSGVTPEVVRSRDFSQAVRDFRRT
jgi:hypothetical protein